MKMSTREERMVVAGTEMVHRLGLSGLEIRYSDDHLPVVWMAIALYENPKLRAQPQVAAALTPADAIYRLLEQLVDGGICTHCRRPTGITRDLHDMPAPELVCWYQYDPELNTFRRGCE